MISARVLPRFPARVEAGAGLAVERANGTYAFSLDFESLTSASQIDDLEATFVPVWNEDTDSYSRLTALSFGGAIGSSFAGVSTSSVSVGTGSKSFTASTGRAWAIGQRLRVADDDGSNVMSGTVTAYDSVTGALTIDVDYTLGSGSHADWNITIGGEVGPTGADGAGSGDVIGPAGATDGRFALFDTGTGKLLKEASGAPGALAYLDTVDLTSLVTGDLPLANIAQIATDRLLGRDTTGTGDMEALTVGGGLEFTGSGGIQRSALTGSVTASAGSNTTAIASGVVTWTNLAAASLASQGDAEAGTATNKFMSPERVAQAIAALAPGGGLTLLNSGTLSAQANLSIVLTSYTAYRGLLLKLINVVSANAAVSPELQLSTDGGSSYNSGASDYDWAYINTSSGAASSDTTDSNIKIGTTVGSAAPSVGVFNSSIEIFGQTATGFGPHVEFKSMSSSDATAVQAITQVIGRGIRKSAQDTDAIRFLFSSGNIASGTWALYGYL